MSLRDSSVSQCLDKKLIMFGFEVFDLLAIFICLSTLNFIFGQTNMKFLFVWLPTIIVGLILRIGKIGKPDKFLIHWLRFQVKPGILSAFGHPSQTELPPKAKLTDGTP